MDWSFRQHWTEHDWSREIRKDELRISGYFRMLPKCLDLPGEDEMIFQSLMSQPEMVPTGVTDPQMMLRNEFEISEESPDWDDDSSESRKRNSFEASKRVENLASEWNLLAAAHLPAAALPEVLTVTCAFGKLISRICNMEETDDSNDTLPLRISLLKHMLADLNDLLLVLGNFKDKYQFYPQRMDEFFDSLAFVREYIIDQLGILRKN